MVEIDSGRFQRAYDAVADFGGYVDADIAGVTDAGLAGISVETDRDMHGSEMVTLRHYYEEDTPHGACGRFARFVVLSNGIENAELYETFRDPGKEGDAYRYLPARETTTKEQILGLIEAALGRMSLLEAEE